MALRGAIEPSTRRHPRRGPQAAPGRYRGSTPLHERHQNEPLRADEQAARPALISADPVPGRRGPTAGSVGDQTEPELGAALGPQALCAGSRLANRATSANSGRAPWRIPETTQHDARQAGSDRTAPRPLTCPDVLTGMVRRCPVRRLRSPAAFRWHARGQGFKSPSSTPGQRPDSTRLAPRIVGFAQQTRSNRCCASDPAVQ